MPVMLAVPFPRLALERETVPELVTVIVAFAPDTLTPERAAFVLLAKTTAPLPPVRVTLVTVKLPELVICTGEVALTRVVPLRLTFDELLIKSPELDNVLPETVTLPTLFALTLFPFPFRKTGALSCSHSPVSPRGRVGGGRCDVIFHQHANNGDP